MATEMNQMVRRIEEGDILVGSFGYEASIAKWYRVLKRTQKTVVLQELEGKRLGGGLMDWTEVPTDEECGKPFRRKVHSWGDSEHVQVEDYIYAYIWDGSPECCYNYH